MKRTVIILILSLLMGFTCSFTAFAEDESSSDLGELGESINERIRSDTDSDVNGIISEYGLSADGDRASALSFSDVLGKLISRFLGELKAPLKLLGKLIAAAMLCSLAQSLVGQGSELTEIYRMIGSLAAILALSDSLTGCVGLIVSSMENISSFMLAYIPIYASIVASMGNFVSGSSYYASDLFLCECIAFLTQKALMPLMSVLIALSAVGAINPDIKLGGSAAAVKRVIQWLLGILMVVFSGLLTVRNTIGASVDSLKARTVRFAASSFIPIIGGAVSESYSTLRGGLGVIRSGTGTLGIIVIAVLVLRPLLSILAYRAIIAAGAFFCELLGQENMARMLREFGTILSIGTSIMICFSMMFIISTSIIMMTAMNYGA